MPPRRRAPAVARVLALRAEPAHAGRLRELLAELAGRGLELDALPGALRRAKAAYAQHVQAQRPQPAPPPPRGLRQRRAAIWKAALRVEQLLQEHLHQREEAAPAPPGVAGPHPPDHPALRTARELLRLLAADPLLERRAPRSLTWPLDCPAVREVAASLEARGVPKALAAELLRLIGIRG